MATQSQLPHRVHRGVASKSATDKLGLDGLSRATADLGRVPPQTSPGRLRKVTGPPRSRRLVRTIVIADLIVIFGSVWAGIALSWGGASFVSDDSLRVLLACLLVILWPVMLWKTQSRQAAVLGDGPEEYRRVLLAGAWTAALVAGVAFMSGAATGRSFVAWVVLLGSVLLLAERHLIRRRLRRQLREGPPLHRVYVVATPQAREHVSKELRGTGGLFEPVGFWELEEAEDSDPERVVSSALRAGADTLVCAPSGHEDASWTRRLAWAMERKDLALFIAPSLSQVAQPRLSIQPVEGLALVSVEMPRFSGPARVIKRIIDLAGATLLLVLFAVPMLLVSVAVRIDSRGPAFFRQTRAGAGGETFQCWKFRTMRQGADAERTALRTAQGTDSATFKMYGDPRITRIGRSLRRYSIDELPQLINVWRGEMSLVGPRPHPMDDVERYADRDRRRLLAKPGMTGLWQVSGRSDMDWEEAVTLDLYYVENWSLSVDFLIAMRTVKAVVKGSGAC